MTVGYDGGMRVPEPPLTPLATGIFGGMGAGLGQYFLSGKSVPWAICIAVGTGVGAYYLAQHLNKSRGPH